MKSSWTGVGFEAGSIPRQRGSRRLFPFRPSFRTAPAQTDSDRVAKEQDEETHKLAADELTRRRGWKKILGGLIDGYAEYLMARTEHETFAVSKRVLQSPRNRDQRHPGAIDGYTTPGALPRDGHTTPGALPPIGSLRREPSRGTVLKRAGTVALVGLAKACSNNDDELREQLARDQHSLPTNFLDLMMWAVLAGQPALATELWGRTREPLRAAILASCVCKTLATYNEPR